MFACREDKYQLRTNVRTETDGRSYLTMEVFRGRERVQHHSDIEMVPGVGAGSEGQKDHGPKVRVYAEFDEAGQGALATMQVRDEAKVLAHATQFVERPAPAGYMRPGVWNGIRPPVPIDRFHPLFVEKAGRNQRPGIVFVEARVNIQGTVDSVVVLNPSPKWKDFERLAAESVRQWRYRPARWDGNQVAAVIVEPVDFRLNVHQ